jgi:hypothetical protein
MPERTPTEKFYDHYERYQSAKSRQGAHWTKVYAMFSISDLRQLVGESYKDKNKDKNECAKVIASLFARIAMTHEQALETYQELYDDSRPT